MKEELWLLQQVIMDESNHEVLVLPPTIQPRWLEVAYYRVVKMLTNAETASIMGITTKTAESHWRSIRDAMGWDVDSPKGKLLLHLVSAFNYKKGLNHVSIPA